MRFDEITGGSPYLATTIAGGDGSRQPTANELQDARYQGRKIAETAKKLHGWHSSVREISPHNRRRIDNRHLLGRGPLLY